MKKFFCNDSELRAARHTGSLRQYEFHIQRKIHRVADKRAVVAAFGGIFYSIQHLGGHAGHYTGKHAGTRAWSKRAGDLFLLVRQH